MGERVSGEVLVQARVSLSSPDTVEPPNKGHFGANSFVMVLQQVSFVERSFLSQREGGPLSEFPYIPPCDCYTDRLIVKSHVTDLLDSLLHPRN